MNVVADPGPFNRVGNHVYRSNGTSGGAAEKTVSPGHQKLYCRYYQKFESGYNFSAGNHAGGQLSTGSLGGGIAGARRTYGYSQTLQHTADARLEYYAYHVGMYMDCGIGGDPDGCYGDHYPCMLGASYCTRPEHSAPPLEKTPAMEDNKWYCVEQLLDGGTPTADTNVIKPDGQKNIWVNGREYGPYPRIWHRKTADELVRRFRLHIYFHDQPGGYMLFDDVAVDTARIGCGWPLFTCPTSVQVTPETGFTFVLAHTNPQNEAVSIQILVKPPWLSQTDSVTFTGISPAALQTNLIMAELVSPNHSEQITVLIEVTNNPAVELVLPQNNPALGIIVPSRIHNSARLGVSLRSPGEFELVLASANGKRIFRHRGMGRAAGKHFVDWEPTKANLSQGVYLISVRQGSNRLTRPFLWMR